MANVARYDPFDLFEGMVKSVLRPSFGAAMERQRTAWNRNFPIDVTENELVLSAEIKQERAVDQGQGREAFLLNERTTGTLSRRVQFAAEIDDAKASAEYRDGVLMLTLPKKESHQVKRLTIH